MNRRYLSLSVALLAGACFGVTPAWSQSSSSSSDQSQQGAVGQSSSSSSTDSGNATSRMHRRSGRHMARQSNVKQIQEALKDKGFDPGPIDGKMGRKTREALRSFQQSKNIKVTGRLDSETAQQLGVSSSTSGTSSSRLNSNMGSSAGAPSSNLNTGASDSPSSDTSRMPAGSTRGSNTGSGH